MVNNEAYSEGAVYAQTLDSTMTVTENGIAKTESTSVKISVNVMFAPEKIVILQMDADSKLLLRAEYKPVEMPDTLVVNPATDYIVVETHKRDEAGKQKITRVVYGSGDENIETFYARPDGICEKRLTQITRDNLVHS